MFVVWVLMLMLSNVLSFLIFEDSKRKMMLYGALCSELNRREELYSCNRMVVLWLSQK